MKYKVSAGIWGSIFAVPTVITDNFLKLVSGDSLKILLYLLRNQDKAFSEEEIIAATGVSSSDVSDALIFWKQANIINSDSDAVKTPSIFTTPEDTVSHKEPAPAETFGSPKTRHELSSSEIAEIISSSADIARLFKIAESALGTLSHTQQKSLIWIHDHLGLKNEVIITLIYYCIKIEKTNSAYIEKLAAAWSENDINTLSAAEEEVQRLLDSREFTGKIMKCFEMKRRPTTKQAEFISQWKSAGYPLEMIRYAYEKTIEQIDKLSFEYINKILLSWHDSGYINTEQIIAAEGEFKRKRKSSSTSGSGFDPEVEKYKIVINKF